MQNQYPSSFTPEQNLRTLVVLAAGMLTLFFIFQKPWLPWISLIVLLAAAFSNWLAAKIAWGWLKLAEFLGKINSRVLLSLVFFVIVFPLALVWRLFVKNPLDLKRPDGSSLYKERNHTYSAQDLVNPW
jgi:hypothetical protein